MTQDKDNNIISIQKTTDVTCKKEPTVKQSLKYIPPGTLENPSEFFKLPSNKEILKDFKLCGGSLLQLLNEHVPAVSKRNLAALQIFEQLQKNEKDLEEYNQISMSADMVAIQTAKEEMIKLSKAKGHSQMTALKAVTDFAKQHPKQEKTKDQKDPMDQHLDVLETK